MSPVPAITAPAPATLSDVKAQGLSAGDDVRALTSSVQLAPRTGTIPLAAGTVVAGILQKFTKSKTIRVAGAVLLLGVGVGCLQFKTAMDAALAAGHHVFDINWADTGLKAIDSAYGFFMASGLTVVTKLWDNDPANPPGANGGA